ncbi:MAG: LPS export ABC transporter periplasmic protein LptC [Acidocella sp. 20-57-95]|nr:MAG: LPS export ABC transporter periplasmic protein LptC [Acidocella sp. 20-57-95]OYV61200.1 MAG: LPS export ABC transporter periplasmic protein LptC [Acidocella sp. 21-58-7]HQT64697.1 LPS export ABC transporter periplasmic protein LptC [Acidocella sp.]HQU04986.1 LPS export ABC transporter periplasmic protein LptC [Acidocella sp.]
MSPAPQSARERILESLRRDSPSSIPAITRRTRMVAVTKAVLPIGAMLLLVALAIAPSMKAGPGADRVTYKVQPNAQASGSEMSNAQYHGLDQHGQPFTVTANTAQDQGTDDVALSKPQGDISLTSGAWLMLRSDSGLFNQKSQTLGLNGNVTLYRNDGTTMTAPDAKIDLKQGEANSHSPVQAQGPFGTLNAAGGFNLTQRGADVIFNGPATLNLNPTNGPAAQ